MTQYMFYKLFLISENKSKKYLTLTIFLLHCIFFNLVNIMLLNSRPPVTSVVTLNFRDFNVFRNVKSI